MHVWNTSTGKVFEQDAKKLRLSRLRKRVHAWASRLHPLMLGKANYRLVMITLTYAGISDWKPNDIRVFMLALRSHLADNLLAYAWVAELQKRGAVHYHLVILVRKGTNIPVPDKSGLWKHGMSKIETARTPFYLLTYTGKEFQKNGEYPAGLRVFAVYIRDGVLSPDSYWMFRLSAYPAWLVKEMWLDGKFRSLPVRIKGGGWSVDGQAYFSPWKIWNVDASE